MKFTKSILVLFLIQLIFFSCAAQLSTENPTSQSSVVIYIKDGSKKKGIVLKRDGDNLVYIDSQSHAKESIGYENIIKLTKANEIYDFEGYPIAASTISNETTLSKTFLYGGGGLILGAAAGAGVGIALVGAGLDLHPGVSIGVFGVAGAWIFGSMGYDRDYDDAIFEVRQQRYKISKAKRDKEIEEEKQKIQEQQKEKQELLKKLEKKKSEDGL
jgi:hypothetical protein